MSDDQTVVSHLPNQVPEPPNDLVQRLQKFLRDEARLNKLIDAQETTPACLRMALEDSLDDWNISPPQIPPVNYRSHPSRLLLIRGGAIHVLISAGILQSRNRLNYNDGGISVQVSDKAGEYSQWITNLVNDYERKKTSVKKFQNINRGWGGVSSEYSVIHGDESYNDI